MDYQGAMIVGRVTADAKRHTSKSGDVPFATFDVAVNGPKEDVTFFPVIAFGKQVEPICQFVTKGRQVLVSGRIQVDESKRFKVVASRVLFGQEPRGAKAEE